MEETDKISKYRSAVIERTINIEWIMNSIITQHYMGRMEMPFIYEVLYDEYFSFALKRRIIEKITPECDGKIIQKLNRINTVRNYFAHCNQLVVEGQNPLDVSAPQGVLDPRKAGKYIDFEKLFEEFTELAGPIEEYLSKIFTDLGGEFILDSDLQGN